MFDMCIFQFNWYTKRASLAGVYKSTEIYMLQDKSENYDNTWQFLERRLQDLTTIGKVTRNVSKICHPKYEFGWGLQNRE